MKESVSTAASFKEICSDEWANSHGAWMIRSGEHIWDISTNGKLYLAYKAYKEE